MPKRNFDAKKKTSTRLMKEKPMQRPSIPPMFAMKVVSDITWGKKKLFDVVTINLNLIHLVLGDVGRIYECVDLDEVV